MVEQKFLHTIRFSDIDKWYVEYYLNSITLTSHYNLIKLCNIISPKKILIKKDDYKGDIPIVDKIVFKTGNIVFRKENSTGMNLYSLDDGDLLVSNINFHQGATAINTYGTIVASTHYQPYLINNNLVCSEYLIKVLRSESFLKMVAGKKAQGIKNESGYSFIGGFKIPVPSIEEQKKLIEKYRESIQDAENFEKKALKLENSINELLFDYLGIAYTKREKSTGLFQFIKLSKCNRWDVDYLIGKKSIDYIYSSKYKLVQAKDFIDLCQYGSSSKADRNPTHTPVLRMNNIQGGEFDISDLKYLDLSEKDLNSYKLNKGDLMFNRTNSKELVGKTAVFDMDGDYVFASYLIRVVINQSKANVNYINYLFGSKIIRDQIDLISRQILGQANVNAEELKEFLFPLPPIEIQNEIVSKVNEIKTQVKELRSKVLELRQRAKNDFERSVFE